MYDINLISFTYIISLHSTIYISVMTATVGNTIKHTFYLLGIGFEIQENRFMDNLPTCITTCRYTSNFLIIK
jgi:hypothetical protein